MYWQIDEVLEDDNNEAPSSIAKYFQTINFIRGQTLTHVVTLEKYSKDWEESLLAT